MGAVEGAPCNVSLICYRGGWVYADRQAVNLSGCIRNTSLVLSVRVAEAENQCLSLLASFPKTELYWRHFGREMGL